MQIRNRKYTKNCCKKVAISERKIEMKRVLILASHHKMAEGLRDTLDFITGGMVETIALSAYVDNQPVEDAVKAIMDGLAEEDEAVILTDLNAGSVNQKFFPYRNRLHTHLLSGMNLPLAMQIAMEPQDEYLTADAIREILATAQAEMKYVNDLVDDGDDEDE
ncbi:PTS sugar transporter subunit IIA [Eubacterium ramulus]